MTLHSTHDERDPRPLWWWMRALVVLASLDYFTVAMTSTITWAVYAQLIFLPVSQATIVDQITAWGARSLIWVLIVCAIATLRLAYRLTKNLEARGASAELPSAGWVCWSFFVPLGNFVIPPLLIFRVWRETFAKTAKPSRGASIIGWWWAAWVVSAILMLTTQFMIRALGLGSPVTPEIREMREIYWGLAALSFAIRGACCWLLLGVFGALVRGQRSSVDASTFD